MEVKKAISQEEMRRVDSGVRSRSGGQQGGYRDNSYGGGGGRDSYSSGYSRGGGGGGGVYPMGEFTEILVSLWMCLYSGTSE